MITAEIKSVLTADMTRLEDYVPENLEVFCIPIRIMAGPRNQRGEESFDVKICSPEWLRGYLEKEPFLFGRHYIFVSHYDVSLIRKAIDKLIGRYQGNSWREVAEKIGQFAYWEFEDYKEID